MRVPSQYSGLAEILVYIHFVIRRNTNTNALTGVGEFENVFPVP